MAKTLNDNPNSETFRDTRGIKDAGQKDAWDRLNPKQEVHNDPDKDTK